MKIPSISACFGLAVFLLVYDVPILYSSVPDSNDKVADIISTLTTASTPVHLPQSNPSSTNIREQTSSVTDKDHTDRFRLKHLNQWPGEESYTKLLNGYIKSFLAELNLHLFGHILSPPATTTGNNRFEDWYKKWKEQKITIIDDTYDNVNKLGQEGDLHKKGNYFGDHMRAKEKTKVTQITLKINSETGNMDINVKQYYTKLVLGLAKQGNVAHVEAIGNDDDIIKGTSQEMGSFSKDDLKNIYKKSETFWEKAYEKKSLKGKKMVDTSLPEYKSSLDVFRGVIENQDGRVDWGSLCSRRKRATGTSGKCFISSGPDGDVEAIDPLKFLEDYDSAGNDKRRQMAKILEENIDKISQVDINTREKLQEILQTEKFFQEIEALEKITDVQSKDKFSGDTTTDPSKIVDKIVDVIDVDKPNRKLSSSKIATSIANSKYAKKFSSGVGAVADPLGKFFLAKSVINGILHNDTTSLAIMGATVGFDMVTDGIASFGKHFFKAASKAGKATKALGKVAGPIGAVADIGLSVWSLTKNVQRLQDATNKYDRNSAIADIVADSVSIAVTSVVTSLSLAFPPAAPLIMAVGIIIEFLATIAIAIFQAANEVARINAEMPLLAHEKSEVFWSRALDFFGTRKPNYIDHLLEEKAVNNAIVQANLKFLQDNTEYLGIVFPSRTLQVENSCTLTVRHCALKIFGRCARWENRRTVGNRCTYGSSCSGRLCLTRTVNVNSGFDDYECSCSRTESFGAPRADSLVDFRRRQSLWWDRTVPTDVSNGIFKCKPGRTTGFNNLVCENFKRTEYLCSNAIGLLQPANRRRPNQKLLFTLENGNDQIYADLNDSTPNVFVVGEQGTKYFYGGGGTNEFIMDGDCKKILRGVLSGGASDTDSITLGKNCAKGFQMRVDLTRNVVSGPSNSLQMTINSVEQVNGRPLEGDWITASCSTKQIALSSGSSSRRDTIDVPYFASCRHNLTLYAGDYTTINSKAGKGIVTTVFRQSWKSSSVSYDIYPETMLTNNIIFAETPSSDIIQSSYSKSTAAQRVTIGLRDSKNSAGVTCKFNFKSQNASGDQKIYLTEEFYDLNTVLIVSLSNNPFVYHNLDKVNNPAFVWHYALSYPMLSRSKRSPGCSFMCFDLGLGSIFNPIQYAPVVTTTIRPQNRWPPRRIGSSNIENIFEIVNSNWNVTGGSLSDEFILHNLATTSTMLDGRGGDDTLRLHQNLKSRITINLLAKSPFQNIETIIGYPGNPAVVTCNCDTKLVALEGGSNTSPDQVNVGSNSCTKRDLQILSKGRTSILIDGEAGRTHADNIAVIAFPSQNSKSNPMQVSITTTSTNTPGVYITAQLTNVNWKVENIRLSNSSLQSLQMNITQGNEYLDLHFKNLPTDNSNYILIPFVQLIQSHSNAVPAQLLINKEDLSPELLFHLDSPPTSGASPTFVQGLAHVKNFFQIGNGTWHVVGGGKDDVIIFSPTSSVVNIKGGNGENTLILEEGHPTLKNRQFSFNFKQQKIGYSHLSNQGSRLSKVSNVFGRINKPDIITCSCDTKTVNGRGGLGSSLLDQILIPPQNCPATNSMNMNIAVPRYTRVSNDADRGVFSYHVEDLATSSLSLRVTQHNIHFIDVAFNPWEIIEDVGFNARNKQLTLNIQKNNIRKLQHFQMYRDENSSLFTNPVFEFHQQGSVVTSDLQVSSDGVTAATIVIQANGTDFCQGIPVDINRILVNITEAGKREGVIRGSDKSTANQFWLFELKTPLKLLSGGGGNTTQNYLDLSENFGNGRRVEINLSKDNGTVMIDGVRVIKKLENIQHLQGRINPNFVDAAVLTCDTKSVSEIEQILISTVPQNCEYNATIGVNQNTTVKFVNEYPESAADGDDLYYDYGNFTNHIFTYKFSRPRTFNVEYEDSTLVQFATHTYLLAINLDDVESMRFDIEEETLYYTIDGEIFNHEMIGGIENGEQFYPQPVMITDDGFRIQIDASGGIYLTLGASSSFPNDAIRSTIIPVLNKVSEKTGATIIIQTDEEFVYVGHGEMEGDRNVLQNVGYTESHLVGGGARDTIYDIVDLTENVYIYPGFQGGSSHGTEETQSRQTIDLSDIVAPIRIKSGERYMPKIGIHKSDIYFEMVGYEDEFPGKIFIVEGSKAEIAGKLQLLLSNSLMDLILEEENWKLKPRPLYIPQGALYTLSKEDFEEGQEIRVEPTSMLDDNTTFHSIRNGTDLIMTTLMDPQGGVNVDKPTTVVILDYFEEETVKLMGSMAMQARQTDHDILHLKVSLPGLNLVLTGSTIQNSLQLNPRGRAIADIKIPEWNSVLKDVEERLLKRVTNITQTI